MKQDDILPVGEFLMFETEDGQTRVECRLVDDTLWLTQALMAALFQKDVRTIHEHLHNIYNEGELTPEATIRKFRVLRQEGKRRVTRYLDHYQLDAILAVGYRVRSARGTQFRRWTTSLLRNYLVKGFALDSERLKHPPVAGFELRDRFDELLESIRDIRASERRMYLRVREIFALAADYAPSLPDTSEFFRLLQNKLHFAVTGKTATELIQARADSTQPNMGLTTWKSDRVQKADTKVAKNYLQEPEITELNRVVVMWLDFAEDQARRRQQIYLKDWQDKLDAFLTFNERGVLPDTEQVTREEAEAHAEAQYVRFVAQRREQLEAQGADFNLKMLETAVQALPPATKKRK